MGNIFGHGIISLMYHRFDENKYPSTNIKKEVFIEQLNEIKKSKIEFISFEKFEELIESKLDKNFLLLTIDDALIFLCSCLAFA